MTDQPLLAGFEVGADEAALMEKSAHFSSMDPDKRRFVLAWVSLVLENGAKSPSIPDVAARAGLGRTKAYELHRDTEVCVARREAAQVFSDRGDVFGSLAGDLAAWRLLRNLATGELNVRELTSVHLNLIRDCKSRLGVAPMLKMAGVVHRSPNGDHAAGVMVQGSGENLSEAAQDVLADVLGEQAKFLEMVEDGNDQGERNGSGGDGVDDGDGGKRAEGAVDRVGSGGGRHAVSVPGLDSVRADDGEG